MQNYALKTGVLTVTLWLFSLMLTGCQSIQPVQQIVGSWDGKLHGFPVVIEYTRNTVSVNGMEPVGYSIAADLVTLDTEISQQYRVQFPSRDEMIQVDSASGAEQKYTRRNQ